MQNVTHKNRGDLPPLNASPRAPVGAKNLFILSFIYLTLVHQLTLQNVPVKMHLVCEVWVRVYRSMGGHPETLETNVLVYDKDADDR